MLEYDGCFVENIIMDFSDGRRVENCSGYLFCFVSCFFVFFFVSKQSIYSQACLHISFTIVFLISVNEL